MGEGCPPASFILRVRGFSWMCTYQGRSVREAKVGLQMDCRGFSGKLLEHTYFNYSIVIDALDKSEKLQYDKG